MATIEPPDFSHMRKGFRRFQIGDRVILKDTGEIYSIANAEFHYKMNYWTFKLRDSLGSMFSYSVYETEIKSALVQNPYDELQELYDDDQRITKPKAWERKRLLEATKQSESSKQPVVMMDSSTTKLPEETKHAEESRPSSKPNTLTTMFWEDEGTLCFQVNVEGIIVTRREGQLQLGDQL